jgi:predicted RecA/RadA family phage recombinase
MAALTAARKIVHKDGPDWIEVGVKNTAVIYHGAMVGLSTSGIQAVPASTTVAPIGVADLQTSPDPTPRTGQASVYGETTGQSITGTSDGSHFFLARQGTFKMLNKAGDLVTTALLGKDVYVEDDQTVRATASGSVVAGKLVGFDDDGLPFVNIGVGAHYGQI